MTINDFNDLVNRMRASVRGRGVAPRSKDTKLVADVDKFVADWRPWFRGPGTVDPLKSFAAFSRRYAALRTRVHRDKKLPRLAKAPKRVSDFPGLPTPSQLGDLGKALAWGAGLLGALWLAREVRRF